jgi:transcriptional regulator with PAS, ATPase and Fis domain
MQAIFTLIEKVKDADAPVLITGESGVGKELIAQSLHQMSIRKDKPFVVQNCAALNEQLLESELFGHVKGAFTGAIRTKPGLFQVADGGTFFLDELGEMSQALQVKLLRVLQDGTFTPVGGTETKQVSVRVVAATNRDVAKMVQSGTFREDLYYRLNVVNIAIPPLRERCEDIPLLLQYFLEKLSHKQNTPTKTLSAAALACLVDYESLKF